MKTQTRDGQSGGAVVELAMFTLVFVPLAMYGIWFSDALHLGIRAQEASMGAQWQATGNLLHDFKSGGGSKALTATNAAKSRVLSSMSSSFDSAQPSASPIVQSVFARPSNLTIDCSDSGPSTRFTYTKSESLAPTKTWVTCGARLDINTTGMPATFAQDHSAVNFLPSSIFSLHLCGIGPGLTGCGGGLTANGGLPVYTDDWGTENGAENALSIGSAGGNDEFWNVNKKFYVAGGSPAMVMMRVAGLGDLGQTARFRLTYRSSGGAFSATESTHGQGGPHGGPRRPHTGGPWHDEGTVEPSVSQKTFTNDRQNGKYLAIKAFPAD